MKLKLGLSLMAGLALGLMVGGHQVAQAAETVRVKANASTYYKTNKGMEAFDDHEQFFGHQVVTATSVMNGTTYRLIEQKGQPVAWVKQAQLVSGAGSAVFQDVFKQQISVASNAQGYYLTAKGFEPAKNPYSGNQVTGAQAELNGQRYYLLTVNGRGMMWVKAEATGKPVATTVLAETGTLQLTSNVMLVNAPAGTNLNRILKVGTRWKVSALAVTANGDSWYQLGKNQWVPGTHGRLVQSWFSDATAKNWEPVNASVKARYAAAITNSPAGWATGRHLAAGKNYYAISTSNDGNGNVWYELADGGWVPASATTKVAVHHASDWAAPLTKAQVPAVIAKLKQQLGKPYVWDGKGPNGFDCSGLMQYAIKQVTGRNIGAFTVTQEAAGTPVALNALQPGDLLFWGPKNASWHVAMYIGNNQYLNALRPGTNIKIDPISRAFMPSFAVRVFH